MQLKMLYHGEPLRFHREPQRKIRKHSREINLWLFKFHVLPLIFANDTLICANSREIIFANMHK